MMSTSLTYNGGTLINGLESFASNTVNSATQQFLGGVTPAFSTFSSSPTNLAAGTNDMRVRLNPQTLDVLQGPTTAGPNNSAPVGTPSTANSTSSNILAPLLATNGLVFPYSPSIAFTQDVDYNTLAMVHTNMDFLGYTRTPSVTLTITGKFTAQSASEGQYALAAIHFLRVVSKMRFGQTDNNAGLPPPVLLLNGYGTYMFNNLKVVLKSHTWSYDPAIDTVPVTAGGGVTRIPAMFDLAVTLVVQQTPALMRTTFNLDQFRTGALMTTGGGWI